MSRRNFYAKLLISVYKKFTTTLILKKNEPSTVYALTKPTHSHHFIYSLRNSSLTQFRVLNDICVVDYPEKLDRFEINYNLLSVKHNFRLFVKSYTSAYVSSISKIFNSAN